MKFSIIVPVYNVDKYLRQCVNSVERQDYKNYEIILVDDGSTDDSPIICDEFKQKNTAIKVIHKKNGGLSDARNIGTEQAKGEYVIYLDSAAAVMDEDGYLPEEASTDGIHCDINYVKRLIQFYRYNTFKKIK